MKSSRREFLQWDAVAGAGMAMPAPAHNIHVLTDGQARTFHVHVSHSVGLQPQSALLAHFVDPLPVPPVIRPATGSVTRIDMNMRVVQRSLHRNLPPTTAKKAARRWAKESALKQMAPAVPYPKPERAETFAF